MSLLTCLSEELKYGNIMRTLGTLFQESFLSESSLIMILESHTLGLNMRWILVFMETWFEILFIFQKARENTMKENILMHSATFGNLSLTLKEMKK
jgi:hypothetical protein